MLLEDKLIFIVEDNTQNRIVFRMILTREGAQVEFDRWGRDALNRLKSLKHVDVILLDLGLGFGSSGYIVFDEIRALPQFEKIPIVAVSATDPVAGIQKTKMKGFNGFIAKPIDDERFPRQLARVIGGESVWDAGVAALKDEPE